MDTLTLWGTTEKVLTLTYGVNISGYFDSILTSRVKDLILLTGSYVIHKYCFPDITLKISDLILLIMSQ